MSLLQTLDWIVCSDIWTMDVFSGVVSVILVPNNLMGSTLIVSDNSGILIWVPWVVFGDSGDQEAKNRAIGPRLLQGY